MKFVKKGGIRDKMRSLVIFGLLLPSLMVAGSAMAISTKTFSNMTVEGDFVLTPGKAEFYLEPGESAQKNLSITNRTGRILNVEVLVEDFTGGSDGSAQLLGSEKGPYSLRDMLTPEVTEFDIAHGEEVTLPVMIDIPTDAEPGGLYASVVFSVSSAGADDGGQGNVSTVSRLGSLFFVRVAGDVDESGFLKEFKANKKIFQHGPVEFDIVYENDGNVYQTPYANVKITNLMGKLIDEIEVDPWFVMPGFSRTRNVSWDKSMAFGKYKAEIELNRNYDEKVDYKTATFWFVPTKAILIVLSVIILIAVIIAWFSSKFELKRKK